jgi:hypothetical protein
LRPDGQSEQILTFSVYACCNPNIFGEIFEILSVHKTEIFGNFHLASSPIIGGPDDVGTGTGTSNEQAKTKIFFNSKSDEISCEAEKCAYQMRNQMRANAPTLNLPIARV